MSRGMDSCRQRPGNFDWFVLSMRMQVILDSSFARPGFSPIYGAGRRRVRGLDYLISSSIFTFLSF